MNLPIDTTKVRFTLLSEPRLQNEYGKNDHPDVAQGRADLPCAGARLL